jgi:diguanylate cyclase (GGDEF)-like protein
MRDRLSSPLSIDSLARLRETMTLPMLGYYWACAFLSIIAAGVVGASALAVGVPLMLIGLIATWAALYAPGDLQTRLILTVAINATWMFGLYVAAGVHAGAYMLEVHMFYFINTAVILAFACWRSVLLTTIAAVGHHLALSLLQPHLVWPAGAYTWAHFGNHAALGTLNCLGACLIALSLQRVLTRVQALAADMGVRAIRDTLTGALNRRGLREGIESLLTHQNPPKELTVMAIDLDGFKQINDTAGHAAGDALLVQVAQKLSELATPGTLVARMGGDEFVLALSDCLPCEIENLLDSFFQWTRQPCLIEGREVRFGASIGLACSNTEKHDTDKLLTEADIALYAAKDHGKNRACWFDAAMRDATLAGKALTDDVLRGLDADEFEPYFQTQHDAATNALVGVEALVRWKHPTRGVLAPVAFLDAVAAAGRMADLDHMMMLKAVKAIRQIEDTGGNVQELAVNVSFSRLQDPGLIDSIRGLPSLQARLTFEIVETVVLDDISTAQSWMIDQLRESGIGMAIDDFGTGHASILGLTRLRPDKLKIDKQMIRPILTSPDHKAILHAVIEMARSLGIATIAEGVETEKEAKVLSEMGVDALQGFAFTRPMSAEMLAQYLVRSEQTNRSVG